MNLEGTDLLQAKSPRRAAEEPAELGNRVHIRSLRRGRQIATVMSSIIRCDRRFPALSGRSAPPAASPALP
jgi:hypothetical protein